MIQRSVSEKVIFKWGPNVRKDPASERRVSHGEGTAPAKALRLVCLGNRKKPSFWRGVGEGEQVYMGGQKKGHG